MNAPLLTLVQWCSALAPIVYIRDSRYGMPAVQSVHLVGITMFLAAVLVLDARLAGIGVLDSSPIRLARQLKPWATGGAALVTLSGIVIFLGTPAKYLGSNPFRVKMAVLCLALLFHVGVVRRLIGSDPGAGSRRQHVIVAAISLTLWFLVGWAGRAIAFIP